MNSVFISITNNLKDDHVNTHIRSTYCIATNLYAEAGSQSIPKRLNAQDFYNAIKEKDPLNALPRDCFGSTEPVCRDLRHMFEQLASVPDIASLDAEKLTKQDKHRLIVQEQAILEAVHKVFKRAIIAKQTYKSQPKILSLKKEVFLEKDYSQSVLCTNLAKAIQISLLLVRSNTTNKDNIDKLYAEIMKLSLDSGETLGSLVTLN